MASVWFKNGDGHYFHVDEGTEAHKRMLEGGFTPCDDPTAAVDNLAAVDDGLEGQTVKELLAAATERDLAVPVKATKAQLIALLRAHAAGGELDEEDEEEI